MPPREQRAQHTLLRPRLPIFWLCLAALLAGLSLAQERHNTLTVNGTQLDGAGPYYFIAHGDSRNAYGIVTGLAESLGATLTVDQEGRLLQLARGARLLTLATTERVEEGLVKRSGVLSVNGENLDSPMGILVNGKIYVPLSPVVKGLGGQITWEQESRTIRVEIEAVPATAIGIQRPLQPLAPIDPPVIGRHEGFTRVVLHLPPGTPYTLAADESQLSLHLPGVAAPPYSNEPEGSHLHSLALTSTANGLALNIWPNHPIAPNGKGYRLGVLPPDADHPLKRIYLDLGPGLTGEPAAELTQLAQSRPLTSVLVAEPLKRVVVIDAGHGGRDPGAVGEHITEGALALNVALKLKALLEAQRVEVILTRDGDYHLHGDKVTDLDLRAAETTPTTNLFISIHGNSADSPHAHGIETWVFGQPLNDAALANAIRENGGGALGAALTDEALEVANNPAAVILRQTQLNYSLNLAELIQANLIRTTGAYDRGIKQSPFAVLRHARVPAVLVELGFVTHHEEGRKLANDAYQTTLAQALASGILAWFQQGGAVVQRR